MYTAASRLRDDDDGGFDGPSLAADLLVLLYRTVSLLFVCKREDNDGGFDGPSHAADLLVLLYRTVSLLFVCTGVKVDPGAGLPATIEIFGDVLRGAFERTLHCSARG